MPLKIHLIEKQKRIVDGKLIEGEAACGEPFYKHPVTEMGPGIYQAVRRIGGLRAVDATEFETLQFGKHVCMRCRSKYWNR